MLDFNIQLPKTGDTRVKAIRQIAVLFRSLIESEETLIEDKTPEQSVLEFIKKQLRGSEAAMFLAFVYPDTETLPSEFEAYNIVTLSNVIDEFLVLRRIMDVNDLLAFESDQNIEKIANACGIPARMIRRNEADPRMMMVRRIYANLNDYERMFPTAAVLLGYFSERYAYDKYSESTRWKQLETRLDMGKAVRENDDIIVNSVADELHDWYSDSIRVLAEMLDIEVVSNRRHNLLRSVCGIGPQEILKRLRDKDLITSAQYDEFKDFNDLSFAQTLAVIAAFWISLHNGSEKVAGQLDDSAKELIDRFAIAHKEDDEDEEEEEEDEEEDEEEEDDSDDSDEEDEEDEEEEDEDGFPAPAPVTRRKSSKTSAATSDELYAALKSMHHDSEFEYEVEKYKLASTESLRTALLKYKANGLLERSGVTEDQIKNMRHYELVELFFAEIMDDYYEFGEKLQIAFDQWATDTSFKRLQFFIPLIEAILPSQDTRTFNAEEAEAWLSENCSEVEDANHMYHFVDTFNALAEKHNLPLLNVDPETAPVEAATTAHNPAHGLLVDRVIGLGVPPTKARTMSASELRAYVAEAEMSGAPEEEIRSVTNENFRERIPELSRQELIAELLARGYSDKSLNKLGAPRLAEMFMAAMERLVAKQ